MYGQLHVLQDSTWQTLWAILDDVSLHHIFLQNSFAIIVLSHFFQLLTFVVFLLFYSAFCTGLKNMGTQVRTCLFLKKK